MLDSWLKYEEQRAQGGPGARPGLTLDQLRQAVTALALRLWETGRQALHLDELTAVAEPLSQLTEARLSAHSMAHAVGSGTLLVRTDEGLFQFIHGSVAEWLVAQEVAVRLAEGHHGLLARRPLSQLAVEFLCDLADHEACQAWAESALAGRAAEPDEMDPDARRSDEGVAARDNAVKILTRLRVPPRTDLRGASLAGQDLTYRDFSGVDLTGADLTDAHLIGANLSGAVLRDARLIAARLDETDLTGADLRGADLRRARLTRADLRGSRLTGSRWNRAALICATTDDAVANAPELRSAAIAPGMPVEVGVRPSAVGVPYGFNTRNGRLPEPVSFTPDGELVAIGGQDGSVLVCDAMDGTVLRTLKGHTKRVYAVQFRSRVLATGSADGSVRLWDPVVGTCLHRLDIHREGVWPVTMDRAGDLLATGDADGVVTVWDVASGRPLHHLPGHFGPVYTTHFSPDGNMLAVGDAAASVRLWDTRTGRFLSELEGHQGSVYRVRFSPDGTLLAVGDMGAGPFADAGDHGERGSVRVWNVAERRLDHEFTGHLGRVYTLDFHPGGRLLASADTKGQVRLWDPVSGRAMGQATGCEGSVYQVVFSPLGDLLAAGDSDGRVRLWHVPPGIALGADEGAAAHQGEQRLEPVRQQPGEHRGSVWACRFRPQNGTGTAKDTPLLVTASNDGVVQLWNIATHRGQQVLRGHGRKVGSLSYSPDGTMLAARGNDGVVRLWETATGCRSRELTGHSDRLVSSVFGPRDLLLATASNDGDMYLWDAGTGESQRSFSAETEHIWAEAFSRDGEMVATANDDDTVRLWYHSTGAAAVFQAQHDGRVRSIAFDPDGKHLTTGCDDRLVRVWDIEDGTLVAQLEGHTDRVYAVVYGNGARAERGTGRRQTHSGHWLATASWDGQAIVWRDGRLLHRLVGHTGCLWTAAAHPSRPLLATAGDDSVIRLWDTVDGTEIHQLTGHVGRIDSVAFSPDGSRLASGGEDGAIRIWTIHPDSAPVLRATLIGAPDAWAMFTPGGGYKYGGEIRSEFWHVVGMHRFERGDLDGIIEGVGQLPAEKPI